jgi:Ran GTPase-activating protein (RanGAP) involved in mRNA processing and transport
MLLLSAHCYKVVSNLDSGDGLHIIQLKEIDPYVVAPLIGTDRTASISLSFSQRRSSVNLSIQNTSFCSVVLKLTVRLFKLTFEHIFIFQGSASATYHNPHLEELLFLSKPNSLINLSVRELIDQDMPIIAQRAIIDKKCKSLYLTGNKISNQSLSILSDALYNNLTLVELDLSDNYISDLGVKILMDVLLTNKAILQKLHLGSNNISDQGIQYLSDMLKTNHSLTHLMLNRNHITNYGVNLLSNVLALHNISLEVLSLSSNNLITDSCVEYLIVMLKHNETLKGLDIKGCNISAMSNQRLQQVIQSKHGFKLFTTANESPCSLS